MVESQCILHVMTVVASCRDFHIEALQSQGQTNGEMAHDIGLHNSSVCTADRCSETARHEELHLSVAAGKPEVPLSRAGLGKLSPAGVQ